MQKNAADTRAINDVSELTLPLAQLCSCLKARYPCISFFSLAS
jgi:hypothetical protein